MAVIITRGTGLSAESYALVPAPLVSFSKQTYSNAGRIAFGNDYTISLQGTIVPTHGNPIYAASGTGGKSYSIANTGFDWTLTGSVEEDEIQEVRPSSILSATISKQEYIRWLFTGPSVSGVQEPIKVQIDGWDNSPGIQFYGYVEDISFDADGRWAMPTSYTVNLRTSSFISSANNIFEAGHTENSGIQYSISSLTDNFDIQEDGRFVAQFTDLDPSTSTRNLKSLTKVFSVSRSITAVGMPVYDAQGGYRSGLSPWEQASGYIYEYVRPQDTGLTPRANYNPSGFKEAGLSFQETIDKEAGTYTLTKNYTLYSGEHPVVEVLTINRDVGENEGHTMTVQGTINGLNTVSGVAISGNAYLNAYAYYSGVIESGGPTGIPQAYYFAKSIMPTGSWLHPKPLSKSVASDFSAGTISYSYSFDDRPPNMVSGSISESIQISDTYPGEIFSVTPVIGRSQPILQYLNSRSEYKRSLNINITMGTPTGYAWNHQQLGADVSHQGHFYGATYEKLQNLFLTQKPSIQNQAELNLIYQAANPVNDPYFTVAPGKCFHSAPTESWDARTRTYSYSIEWTYERL